MKHVLMDLETLAVKPRAVVIEMAAAEFDPWTGGILHAFEAQIRQDYMPNNRRDTDAETIAWWREREQQGHRIPGTEDWAQPLTNAATGFMRWWSACGGTRETRVWSWGIDFDCVIWRSALDECGHPAPWNPFTQRDARTLAAAAGVVRPKARHRAMADVLDEVAAVHAAVKALQITDNGRF